MSEKNKVVWSEGLFLRPQHLQQQERYFERYVEGRAGSLLRHGWGFLELEIDRDLLAIGEKRVDEMTPDEAGAASYQYMHTTSRTARAGSIPRAAARGNATHVTASLELDSHGRLR